MSDPIEDLEQADEQLDEKKQEKESKATQLVKLALSEGAELFHTPEGEAFATVPIDGRRETWPLKTKTVRRWLARLFYLSSRRHPGRRRSRMRSPCSKARRCSTDWSTPSTCGR